MSMKILKYIGSAVIESLILMTVFFLTPTITKNFKGNTVVWVYVFFAAVIIAEYLYLWFRKKGHFFTVPLSLIFILLLTLIHFSSPDNVKAVWALLAIGKNFVLPVLIVSLIVSGGLWYFNKIRTK